MECDVRSMPRPHMERCTHKRRTHQSACARTLCPEHRSSIATRVALVEWGWRRWSDARPPLQNIMAHTHQKIHPRWILSHRMRSGHWHRDRRLGLTQTPPQVPPRQPEGIPPRVGICAPSRRNPSRDPSRDPSRGPIPSRPGPGHTAGLGLANLTFRSPPVGRGEHATLRPSWPRACPRSRSRGRERRRRHRRRTCRHRARRRSRP